jgi:hypothetical protein
VLVAVMTLTVTALALPRRRIKLTSAFAARHHLWCRRSRLPSRAVRIRYLPIRHLFLKLGAPGRTEAVARARAAGLLAPSPGRS